VYYGFQRRVSIIGHKINEFQLKSLRTKLCVLLYNLPPTKYLYSFTSHQLSAEAALNIKAWVLVVGHFWGQTNPSTYRQNWCTFMDCVRLQKSLKTQSRILTNRRSAAWSQQLRIFVTFLTPSKMKILMFPWFSTWTLLQDTTDSTPDSFSSAFITTRSCYRLQLMTCHTTN